MDALRSLHHIDKDVTLAINSWNSPATDVMWQVFSDNKIWIVLYLAIAALIIVRLGWKRGLILIACCAVCVAAIDQFTNVIKMSVQRLRPVHDAEMMARGLHVLEVPGLLYGFFSAHAANATAPFRHEVFQPSDLALAKNANAYTGSDRRARLWSSR